MTNAGRAALGFLFLLVFSSEPAFAQYVQVDVEQVPVERLVANVQKKIEAEPNNAQWRYTLARLYSMAYATGTQTWESPSGSSSYQQTEAGLPWFGYGDSLWPNHWTNYEKNLSLRGKPEFQNYLDQAIENYRLALKLDPSHLYSRLGLAWCLQEKGQTEEAITAYRQTFQQTWQKERGVDHGMRGNSIAIEAGTMLLELLPKTGAEKERAKISKRIEILGKKFTWVTPLIVPLQETSIESLFCTDPSKAVRFDLDGFGTADWQWITPKAGLLVWDPKQTGVITSGRQLFGNVTWWIFWADGYQPLSLLDDNNDGKLSGKELKGLSIWQDLNSDGVSQPGEVKPLEAWRIISLACRLQSQINGTLTNPAGVTFSDGTTRPTYDWVSQKLDALSPPQPRTTSRRPPPILPDPISNGQNAVLLRPTKLLESLLNTD